MSDVLDENHEFFETARLVPPIVKLWMLRHVIHKHVLRELIRRGYDADLVLETLIDSWSGDVGEDDDVLMYVQGQLRNALRVLENAPHLLVIPSPLAENIERLARLLDLDPAECRILACVVLMKTHAPFEMTMACLGHQTAPSVGRVIVRTLGLPETKVQFALSNMGMLARSGILRIIQGGFGPLESMIELLSTDFSVAILGDHVDPLKLLAGKICKSPAPRLDMDAFAHLDPRRQIIRRYLDVAIQSRQVGVNVLLYGPPGTGKTELSRAVALALQCVLYEVTTQDSEGQAIKADLRLRAYTAAQRFLKDQRTLLLFDEIEDVFQQTTSAPANGSAPVSKGAMNKLLEENPVPTVWISNSIQGIDAAYIRRFDVVLEVPVPPREVRERITREALGCTVEPATILRIAESSAVAPAVLTRAACVLQAVEDQVDSHRRGDALLDLINGTLQAQGHARLATQGAEPLGPVYDPTFVHADCDLRALAEGIREAGSARLCLFGPPGTGKTAYARWLAQQMERHLMVQRASDLLSMWLGESEQNIARAFQDAQRQDCVLLIDEIDSFLQDRRGAARSWEITQVNEMLTRMETFSGVFIATTNLMGHLDPAALRRFDLKARFDYLLPDQAWRMLQRVCETLGLPRPGHGESDRLNRLVNLTPGDFAAVARRHRFRPLRHAAGFVSALESECMLKEGPRASIGFV